MAFYLYSFFSNIPALLISKNPEHDPGFMMFPEGLLSLYEKILSNILKDY